jgi:hypothetical protein
VWAWENLHLAWRKARKGKRGREAAATFEFDLEGNLIRFKSPLKGDRQIPLQSRQQRGFANSL